MRTILTLLSPGLLILSVFAHMPSRQPSADPALVAVIAGIKTTDNHSHVMGGAGAGEEDHEYDAAHDALVLPLNNEAATRSSLNHRAFYPAEEPSAAGRRPGVLDLRSIEQLKEAFQRDSSNVRLVALLSPT